MNYSLLIFATVIAILPIIFIKQYIATNKNYYVILSFVAYILLFLAYYKIFKTGQEISIIYTLLQILQIIIVLFVGLLFFKEKITKNKIIGTVLGITSIYFLLAN